MLKKFFDKMRAYDAGLAFPGWYGYSTKDKRHFFSDDASTGRFPVTPAPGDFHPNQDERFVITDIIVSTDTEMRIDFVDELTDRVILRGYAFASTPFLQITPRGKMILSINSRLMVQTSAAGNISVTAFY